ncbi:CIC11C00000001501 [Sungouiella intermedia]|uniref:CIC11C00000001501 n=1 Tax=Sungouiella intermedia TaxID=45354 RepID=A0A1L0DI01_9ASCO|nr:CIC11C00000001501 [[Candida] intermedia]
MINIDDLATYYPSEVMATVAQIQTDLADLAHEVKRRNHDVRLAIDHATAESRKVSPTTVVNVHPNLQMALYLPFISSLSSGNPKLVNSALLVILRLATLSSLSHNQLLLIVDSLHQLDIGASSLETQLKTLQACTPLATNYTLDRDHFLRIVAVCSRLASNSNVVVANTASATLQQVFSSLFDKLRNHETETKNVTVIVDTDMGNEKVPTYQVDDLEAECFYVFLDLSSAIDGGKLEYFDTSDIKLRPQAALEIIENILSLAGDVFESHEELAALLKSKTVPAMLKVLNSPGYVFSLVVRTLRTLHILLASHMTTLNVESEIVISFANHIMLNSNGSDSTLHDLNSPTVLPFWEKVLVLEFYKGLFSHFSTVRQVYANYDSISKKKNVLHEVLTVINNYLLDNFSQNFNNDTIQIPQDRGGNQLSKATSTMKVAVLDHLDKIDPPDNIPSLYPMHLVFKILVSFSEGVSDFVSNLSTNANPETLERDVEFITSMNEEVFPEIFHLYKKFIYCNMDSEYFHTCVRALQKYTHAIGILGLSSLRDGLLLTLSDCCTRNAAPEDAKKNGASHFLSIGESIVESISSSIQSPAVVSPSLNLISQFSELSRNTKNDLVGMRSFNSRQVVCLRALSNLALSLGSTLQGSWKIIWITFQWVDYFMKGPDQFSGYSNLKDVKKFGEPRLTSQDLNTMDGANKRFLESIHDYQQLSYKELVHVLIELYDGTKNGVNDDMIPIEVCPFNKIYFIDQLVLIAKLNPQKFLFYQEDTWNQLIDYFITLGTNRSIQYGVRNYLVKCFTNVIVDITRQGFDTNDEKLDPILAEKSLKSLLGFLQNLHALGTPQEHLVLNCETEIHLTVLVTVHGLIDGYVEKYQNSWDLVFAILNTAFINTEATSVDANLNDKIVSLISTSFGTLKLILDEFLTSLPSQQLKSLIDTLLNFCSQKFDLNISFSSVSYFWLISDCISSKIGSDEMGKISHFEGLSTISELESLLANSNDSATMNQALNIYLLAQLSNLSTDKRARVREGAIQTLFQIIDVQGKQISSWRMVYDIVLPGLLDLTMCFEIKEKENRTDATESLNLVLSGLVSMYTKFMMDFENEDEDLTLAFWKELLQYFDNMFHLSWKGLNLKIFESYQDLVMLLSRKAIPEELADMLFEFWVNVSIDYDFVNPDYLVSLAVYNRSFKPLYQIIKDKLDFETASRVMSNLNKCARYPVLKPGLSDTTKPTELQQSVLDNLVLIDKKGEKEEILAAVIQQLGLISSYPFEIRGRIEAKLKSIEARLKIPSFIAISSLALNLVKGKIAELSSTTVLLADKVFIKLVRSLLYLVRYKAQGISGLHDEPLWVQCNNVIHDLISRFLVENGKAAIDKEIWELILDCITVCFETLTEAQEKHNVRQYEQLTKTVLPVLFAADTGHPNLVDHFVYSVYQQSFLYESNDIEKDLVGNLQTSSLTEIRNAYKMLCEYHFEESFGTTAVLLVYENRDMRFKCLTELFKFASASDRSSPIAMECLITRTAFTLRRFTADEGLLLRKPLPKIQREEISVILLGLRDVSPLASVSQMAGINYLLSLTIPYATRLENISYLIEDILREGHTG